MISPLEMEICTSTDAILQPGANEITIYGLTPTADESSIKVDGRGSATVTDMMVDLVPSRENFDDIYPEDSEDSEAMDEDQEKSESESETINTLAQLKRDNDDRVKQASEERASASGQLAMLEHYARSLEEDRPQDLEACVTRYREERKKVYDVHFASEAKLTDLEREGVKIQKRYTKALQAIAKERERAQEKRNKELKKKYRACQMKLDDRNRRREERVKFWPRKVHRIILTLDTNSDVTPASSRHASIDSLAKTVSDDSAGSTQISLSVSYITYSAWWSPRYDLTINTLSKFGTVLYRAEYCNTTSESWNEAKVILSTSQTAFQGLGEPIPSMQPWHICLSKDHGQAAGSINGALLSSHEIDFRRKERTAGSNQISQPRNALFGLGNNLTHITPFGAQRPQPVQQQAMQYQAMPQARQQQAYQQQAHQQQAQHGSLFGAPQQRLMQSQPNAGGLFGSVSGPSHSTAFGQNVQPTESIRLQAADEAMNSIEGRTLGDFVDNIVPELPSLATQESEWSEAGMTATYEIPGRRTLAPSNTMRRHKIAAIELNNVHLSYLLVPKLRAAAFLKARIQNTSGITLLRGPVGLTLDGSFLGNASLPRCSAGEPFSLSLGVDPSVNVLYSKPVVKRSLTGVFQKEGSSIYTRTCTVTNTRSDRPLEGLVLDQIPQSEDERLKVDILQPSGLRSEGDTTKSGTGVAAIGKVTEKWGSAKATLKKGGEICWNINIEPSRAVKLVLEYEARFPSTETVVGC